MKNKIYEILIDTLRKKIPNKKELISTLVGILCIEKEAVYRRLRGDIQFSFEEIIKLTQTFNISLDNMISLGIAYEKLYPARIADIDFLNPGELDYANLTDFIQHLRRIRHSLVSEIGIITNSLPQLLYVNYDSIFRFFLLRNLYRSGIVAKNQRYADLEIDPGMITYNRKYQECLKYSRHTSVIWDRRMFRFLVDDINYFLSIRLITPQEVKVLRDDLLRFIEETEKLAARGYFRTPECKVEFYVSGLVVRANQAYIKIEEDFVLSLMEWFSLIDTSTQDIHIYNRMKTLFNSMKRSSVLISESSETQRILFFRQQREIVQQLSEKL
ncbi:MAG: hypothetical protein LUD15_00840 [Bacteroides sp.]|nr:hypothetical protein [Bacteroides sp.]